MRSRMDDAHLSSAAFAPRRLVNRHAGRAGPPSCGLEEGRHVRGCPAQRRAMCDEDPDFEPAHRALLGRLMAESEVARDQRQQQPVHGVEEVEQTPLAGSEM
jgi:hypothetical protein